MFSPLSKSQENSRGGAQREPGRARGVWRLGFKSCRPLIDSVAWLHLCTQVSSVQQNRAAPASWGTLRVHILGCLHLPSGCQCQPGPAGVSKPQESSKQSPCCSGPQILAVWLREVAYSFGTWFFCLTLGQEYPPVKVMGRLWWNMR